MKPVTKARLCRSCGRIYYMPSPEGGCPLCWAEAFDRRNGLEPEGRLEVVRRPWPCRRCGSSELIKGPTGGCPVCDGWSDLVGRYMTQEWSDMENRKYPDAAPGRSPFQRATATPRRLKLFIWGDSGVGKTTLALRFPEPAVIDLEGGTELYGGAFEFHRLPTSDPDSCMEALDWLLRQDHPYRTLVVDPITIYWEALQKKWSSIFLRRNRRSSGFKHDYYELQPKDWAPIKAEFKSFCRKLIALDMNVVVTARMKPLYDDATGSFMKRVGDTFDGEKSLPYLFDTILELAIDDKGNRCGIVRKDRSNRLPTEPFEPRIEVFRELWGTELDRKAAPADLASPEQIAQMEDLLDRLGLDPTDPAVAERLAKYDAESLKDLSRTAAAEIISRLQEAADQKAQKEETANAQS